MEDVRRELVLQTAGPCTRVSDDRRDELHATMAQELAAAEPSDASALDPAVVAAQAQAAASAAELARAQATIQMLLAQVVLK